MRKNKKSNSVNKTVVKNYIIIIIVFVLLVILSIYIGAWVKAYKKDILSKSPLDGVIEKVNLSELDVTLAEMNEVVLYVGYLNNQTVHDTEEDLLEYIKREDLADKFIYVDVTDYLKDNEYLNILKDTFTNISDNIKEAPLLIYVKNKEAIKVINSVNGKLYTYDVASLNDLYQLQN